MLSLSNFPLKMVKKTALIFCRPDKLLISANSVYRSLLFDLGNTEFLLNQKSVAQRPPILYPVLDRYIY